MTSLIADYKTLKDHTSTLVYGRDSRGTVMSSSRPPLSVHLNNVADGSTIDNLSVLIWVNRPTRNPLFQNNPSAHEIHVQLDNSEYTGVNVDLYTTVPAILANLASGNLFTLEWMSRYATMRLDNLIGSSPMTVNNQQLFKNILASAVLQINPLTFLAKYMQDYRSNYGNYQTLEVTKMILARGWQVVTLGELFLAELDSDGISNPLNRLQLITTAFDFPNSVQTSNFYRQVHGNTNPHRELWTRLLEGTPKEVFAITNTVSNKTRDQVKSELRSLYEQVMGMYEQGESMYGTEPADFSSILPLLGRL